MREHRLFGLILILLVTACAPEAPEPEGYRFPRAAGTTEAGYPLPLSGEPITKTPVIAAAGVSVKEYPELYWSTDSLGCSRIR